jgi:hydrogenase expression/formation protein HypC
MCLAIPAKVIELTEDGRATIDLDGVQHEASIELVPDAAVGSYVLVHAGYAISVLDEDEALETLKLFREMAEIAAAEDARMK